MVSGSTGKRMSPVDAGNRVAKLTIEPILRIGRVTNSKDAGVIDLRKPTQAKNWTGENRAPSSDIRPSTGEAANKQMSGGHFKSTYRVRKNDSPVSIVTLRPDRQQVVVVERHRGAKFLATINRRRPSKVGHSGRFNDVNVQPSCPCAENVQKLVSMR